MSQDKNDQAGDVHTVPTILRVTRTVNASGESTTDTETSEILEVNKFATQPAIVHFSYPIKKALEYQSAGFDVGVSLPCYVEELDEGMKRAKRLIIEQAAELLPEVDAVLDKLVDQALESKRAISRGTWSPKGQ